MQELVQAGTFCYLGIPAVREQKFLAEDQEKIHVQVPLMDLVENDVGPLVEILTSDDHSLQNARGDVEEPGVRTLVGVVEPNL